tara:strand:- start:554 stop:655 length:102 start_codon:yes stop_codon:yes gene_type:complete
MGELIEYIDLRLKAIKEKEKKKKKKKTAKSEKL